MEGHPRDDDSYLDVEVVVEVDCLLCRQLPNVLVVLEVHLGWQQLFADFGCSRRLHPIFCAFPPAFD